MFVMTLSLEWVFSLPFASHGSRLKAESESRVGELHFGHWTTEGLTNGQTQSDMKDST